MGDYPAYPAYPAYKDSGIPWLGDVPAHWEVRPLKRVATVQPSNVDKKSEDDELPVLLCNYTDVYNNEEITSAIDFMQATATPQEIEKFRIVRGDVIVTKDSESPHDIAVPAYVAEDFGNTLCGYHLTQIRSTDLDGKFLFRLFQSTRFNAQFVVGANGVTRFGLPQRVINDAPVAFPPLAEQQVIARFLDHKTAQIDTLIAKNEALLAALAERRTALITHAVTKGLDPAAPLRDSGIDWLGEIPAHWEYMRLRFLLDVNPSKQHISQPGDTPVSFVPMEAVGEYGGLDLSIEKPLDEIGTGYTYFADGDVVVAKITPCFENGKGALASGLTNGVAFGTTELHVLRPNADLDVRYLFYLTISRLFRKVGEAFMYGAGGQKRVPEQFISDLRLGIPPEEEQKEIASFLDQQSAHIDKLEGQVTAAIAKLKEYRAALITHAVTGKIDVRGVSLPTSRS